MVARRRCPPRCVALIKYHGQPRVLDGIRVGNIGFDQPFGFVPDDVCILSTFPHTRICLRESNCGLINSRVDVGDGW